MDFSQGMTILALLISAAALFRNLKGDNKGEGAVTATILTKVELVQSDIKEIKADFKAETKALRAEQSALRERITVVEQSAKSAHKRIDNLHNELSLEEQNRD